MTWPWEPRYPTRRTVIVSCASGKDFKGVLWSEDGRYLVLRNAELYAPREAPKPLVGEVVIPREQVEFLQVVAP